MKNFITLDLGASNSRIMRNGTTSLTILDNGYNFMELGEVSTKRVESDDIMKALEFTIEKTSGESKYFPLTAQVGEIAYRTVSNESLTRPNSDKRKWEQKVNYVTSILAVAIKKALGEIDGNIKLFLLVPPIELDVARREMPSELVGSFKVTFPKYKGGTTVEFTIDSMDIYAESVMVLRSYEYDVATIKKKQTSINLSQYKVLSVDIGASTTDLCVIDCGHCLEYTGKTLVVGGNTLRAIFNDIYTEETGKTLSRDNAERGIREGRIASGISYEDVSKYVRKAKKELAKMIVSMLDNYFDKIGFKITEVAAILVSGGGSMPSRYFDEKTSEYVETSESVAKFVTDSLKEISENTAVIQYSDGDDSRYANIYGLEIQATVDVLREEKAAQKAKAEAEANASANA